jgi:hypothetical protein
MAVHARTIRAARSRLAHGPLHTAWISRTRGARREFDSIRTIESRSVTTKGVPRTDLRGIASLARSNRALDPEIGQPRRELTASAEHRAAPTDMSTRAAAIRDRRPTTDDRRPTTDDRRPTTTP